MKVLSLFDGMACGRIALEQLGIPVEKYYASEIDKYAIQVAQANYPDIIQVGDVCDLDPKDYMDVDLIQAGSPCQGFSMAGKQLAFDDPRSALFFEFIRLLKAIKPKYFLLENVKMKKEFLQVISEQVSACYPEIIFGIEPIFINSSLLSAQSRQRYYWTNIPGIQQPEDRGIVLKDILEDDFSSDRDKSYCIDANYSKTGVKPHHYKDKYRRQLVNKPIKVGMNVEEVKIRKHKVDEKKLQTLLRDSKKDIGKTNKQIANETNLPVTKVEHWFRTDNSFAIPGDDVWLKLKTILNITDNTFDKQIMEFEYRDGVFESTQRVYSDQGKSPTLTASNKEQMIETKPKQVGVAVDIKGHDQIKRVYSPEGKSPTVNTCQGGNREPKVVTGGAFRGRAYDKDGKRMDKDGVSVANKTKQMLELRQDGKSNAITTVGKDSVVVEKLPDKSKVLKANYYKSSKANFENDTKKGGKFTATGVPLKANISKDSVAVENLPNKSQTIKSQYYKSSRANFERQGTFHATGVQQEDLTWRKLSPLECERLQTVPDNYTNHVSNTQRYKMLGNGWTVEVIKHIYKNMNVS